MKILSGFLCLFLLLLLFGSASYIYILWNNYWQRIEKLRAESSPHHGDIGPFVGEKRRPGKREESFYHVAKLEVDFARFRRPFSLPLSDHTIDAVPDVAGEGLVAGVSVRDSDRESVEERRGRNWEGGQLRGGQKHVSCQLQREAEPIPKGALGSCGAGL